MKRLLPIMLALALSTISPPMQIVPAMAATVSGEDYLAGAWLFYRSRFLTDDGRVVDNANGDVSHSEGQGFGMLLAVAADDRSDFNAMWKWTRDNLMIRDDGLAAWRWDPASDPFVADENNATDGDLLIAWALLRAYKQWGDLDYFASSRAIASAIGAHAVEQYGDDTLLLPGASGFGSEDREDGPIVNLSYWIFPAIYELSVFAPEFPADQLIATGLSLVDRAQFGDAHLPADWISLAGDTPVPAADFPPTFGYDAIRIPLYLAWYPPSGTDRLARFTSVWSHAEMPSVINLASGEPTSQMSDPGYRAIIDLARCSTADAPHRDLAQNFDLTHYYPSTLDMLSLLAMVERYPRCLEAP